MDKTHACPGGCGQRVRRDLFACRADWYRLPKQFRDPILAAWRAHDGQAHAHAMRAAADWYRTAPRASR